MKKVFFYDLMGKVEIMEKEKALYLLKKTGALLEGHFLLSSGNHSKYYIQCAHLMSYPDIAEEFFNDIADHFRDYDIDTVVGPAVGGIVVSYGVAKALNKKSIFMERENGIFTLRRGFEVKDGERVLLVEDVITTGGSILEVANILRKIGAKIIGYASIVNRASGRFKPDADYYYSIKMDFPIYNPDECPLCRANIPLVKHGSRGLK